MIAKLLLAACVVGVALGNGRRRDCCSPGDRAIVQAEWSKVWGSGDAANVKTALGKIVFEKLFEELPDSRALFRRVNGDNTGSPEFLAHAVRVLNGVDTVVNLLQDEESAKAELSHLADQHAAREGVTASQFKVLGQILLDGLENLVPTFTRGAWEGCFGRIANGITAGLPA